MLGKNRNVVIVITALIVLIGLLSLTRCGRKDEMKPEKLGKDTEKVLEKTDVPLYPQSQFIRENIDTEQYLRPTPTGLSPEDIKTTEVWIAAAGTFDDARLFYQNLYPNVITERKLEEKTVFLQLSNTGDLKKASEDKMSPVILVDIRDSSLSAGEKSAYSNELNALKENKSRDAVADRRRLQLEEILKEKPLIKISIREVTDAPKTA